MSTNTGTAHALVRHMHWYGTCTGTAQGVCGPIWYKVARHVNAARLIPISYIFMLDSAIIPI